MENDIPTLRRIETILKELRHEMAVDFTRLQADLAKNADAVGGIKALVQRLLAEVDQISKSADAPTQAALDDLTTQFEAQVDDLSKAVVSGTAADPANAKTDNVPGPADPAAPKATQIGGSQ